MVKELVWRLAYDLGYKVQRAPRHDPLRKLGRRERKEFRELSRDRSTNLKTTGMLSRPLNYFSGNTFCQLVEEIWCREIYRFRASNTPPRILDCGANIGIGSLYFKRLYPDARITAFEPDARVFDALKRNIQSFGHSDVELVNSAVWVENCELSFVEDPASTGGRLTKGENGESAARISAVRLADYLNEPIDLLKLDIEGAETQVLADVADRLDAVQYLFVEYHSTESEPQRLHELLTLLNDAGFRLYLEQGGPQQLQPLMSVIPHKGFDALLNVFAFRAVEQKRTPKG